jgi:hypothetical protein
MPAIKLVKGIVAQISATVSSLDCRTFMAVLPMVAAVIVSARPAGAAQAPPETVDLRSGTTRYSHLSEFFDQEPGGTTAVDLHERSKRFAVLQNGRWHSIKKPSQLQFYYHTGKEAGPRTALLVEAYRLYCHGTIAPNQCVSVFRNSPWPTDGRSNTNPFPHAQNTNLTVDQFRKSHTASDLLRVNAALKKPWHAEVNKWDTLQAFRSKITDGFFGQIAPGGHVNQAFVQADAHLLPQQTWRLIAYSPDSEYRGGGSTILFTIDLDHGDEKYVVFRTVTPNSDDDPYYVLVLE